MRYDPNKLYPGQEALTPDGFGRIKEVTDKGIYVDTYINNRCCRWDHCNVVPMQMQPVKEQGPIITKEDGTYQLDSNADHALIDVDDLSIYIVRSSPGGAIDLQVYKRGEAFTGELLAGMLCESPSLTKP